MQYLFHMIFFEMGIAPASAAVDAHNLLLKKWIFKCYKAWINEGWYKNQASKNKKYAKQSKNLLVS
jgi:hypothetical protein